MSDYSRSRTGTGGQPLFGVLMAVPAVCFVGALLTDITYSRSPDMQWTNFSAWLLAFAELFGAFALLVALIDLRHAAVRRISAARWRAVGLIVVLVLGLFNNLVHSRDAWTSVVPQGLIISIVTVLILLPTLWLGSTLTYRHRLGVA